VPEKFYNGFLITDPKLAINLKILITRPRDQSDAFANCLLSAGFEPVFFPVIEIRQFAENVALERAIASLKCYEWVVFTSANGVDAFFEHSLHPTPFQENGRRVKVAAIGSKTAGSLSAHGVTPDFVPEEFVAEAILPGLGDLRGCWVLLPSAEISRDVLAKAIFAEGGIPHEIAVYRTLPTEPDPDGLVALKTGVDVVTFTSPSTVDNFVKLALQECLDPLHLPGCPKIACIGPITQKAAEEAGFSNVLMAEEYTTEGLVNLLSTLEK
jgi:uroporphyrinogen III methyltransferase/synthase